MNKRGISDTYLIIIQVVLLGIIFVALIGRANSIDIDSLRRIMVSENLGFVMSTIAAIPGNFYYSYLTEEDNQMLKWDDYYSHITKDGISYAETADEVPISNVGLKLLIIDQVFDITSNVVTVGKNSITIQKTDNFELKQSINKELRKLECTKTSYNLPIRPLKSGDANKYYDKQGNEITGEVITKLNGFEEEFYTDNKRVYKGLGIDKSLKLSKLIDPSLTDNYISPENLKDKHILLSFGDYEPRHSFIIAYVPKENYEENYNVACNIINQFLDPTIDESSFEYNQIKLLCEVQDIWKDEIDNSDINAICKQFMTSPNDVNTCEVLDKIKGSNNNNLQIVIDVLSLTCGASSQSVEFYKDQLNVAIDGVAIIPTHDKHIIFEIGNVNKNVLHNDDKLALIAEVLRNGQ